MSKERTSEMQVSGNDEGILVAPSTSTVSADQSDVPVATTPRRYPRSTLIGMVAASLVAFSVLLPWVYDPGMSVTRNDVVGGLVVNSQTMPAVPYIVLGITNVHGMILLGLNVLYLVIISRMVARARTALIVLSVMNLVVLISFQVFRGPNDFMREVGVGYIVAIVCAVVACVAAAMLKRPLRKRDEADVAAVLLRARSTTESMQCGHCDYIGAMPINKRRKPVIVVLGLILYILPGIIYLLMSRGYAVVCPSCGSVQRI